MNAGVTLCLFVPVIAGIFMNWKRYRDKEISKKYFLTNMAVVGLLTVIAFVLLTDKI